MTLLDPDGDIVPDTGGMSRMGGKIDATGVHTIKVYLTEPQAEKNTKVEYTLKIRVQNKR